MLKAGQSSSVAVSGPQGLCILLRAGDPALPWPAVSSASSILQYTLDLVQTWSVKHTVSPCYGHISDNLFLLGNQDQLVDLMHRPRQTVSVNYFLRL